MQKFEWVLTHNDMILNIITGANITLNHISNGKYRIEYHYNGSCFTLGTFDKYKDAEYELHDMADNLEVYIVCRDYYRSLSRFWRSTPPCRSVALGN